MGRAGGRLMPVACLWISANKRVPSGYTTNNVPLHAEVIRSPRVKRLVLPKATAHRPHAMVYDLRGNCMPAQTFRLIHGTYHTSKMPVNALVAFAHSA
jgi:hypothetical protein